MKKSPLRHLPVLVLLALFLPTLAFGQEEAHGGGHAEKQTLIDLYKEGGWVMHFLVICSVGLVWLTIDVWLRTNKSKMSPTTDVEVAKATFMEGDYVGAYQQMKGLTSPFAQAVRSGLASIGHGKAATEEAIFLAIDRVNSVLQTRINYLSVIGVCSPMIGLVGTVSGMKGAFGALNTSGADVGGLAGHIGEVLVATATGLIVAIPAFITFYFLRNRLQGSILNLHHEVERLFRNAPYEYLVDADVGQEETYAALPNWIEGVGDVAAEPA